MIKYKFEDVQLNDAFVSGEVMVDATTPNTWGTAPWDMKDSRVDVDWNSLELNSFTASFMSADGPLVHDIASAAVYGYGFDKFKKQISAQAYRYVEFNDMWE